MSRSSLDDLRVLLVTDGVRDVRETASLVADARRRGARFALLVRAYASPIDAQVAFARALRAALPEELPVLFAGHPSHARDAHADGVHLGRRVATITEARALFGDKAWVSVPAHDVQDIADAEREGAYAALVSPVLGVPEKGPPLGFSGLSCMIQNARPRGVRCFALGGLGSGDVRACLTAGASGVAVIRSVWTAPDPAEVLRALTLAAGAQP